MKKILLISTLFSLPVCAMQKPTATPDNEPKEGLLEFVAAAANAANPLIASAGEVLKKQVAEPLASHEHQLIVRIVSPILAEQQKNNALLCDRIQRLQNDVTALHEAQAHNKCCNIQ